MKFSQVTFLSLALLGFKAWAAPSQSVECATAYSRINPADSWGLSSDTNGDLNFDLTPATDDPHRFEGTSTEYHFVRDQSSDSTVSPYSIKARAVFSDGDGLQVTFVVYKTQGSTKKIIGNFGTSSDQYTGTTFKTSTVTMIGQELVALADSTPIEKLNLRDLINQGKLKLDDLVSVSANFCRLEVK